MNLFKIFHNRLFRLIGIFAILYFALFHNKENPNSLGNVLTKDNIDKSVRQVSKQTQTIVYGLDTARKESEIVKQRALQQQNQNMLIAIQNVEIGNGETTINCQDKVQIELETFSVNNNDLLTKEEKEFVVGEKIYPFENYLIGMKKDGIRILKIPAGFISNDAELKTMLQNNGGLVHKIKIINFTKAEKINNNINCS